MEAMEMKIPNNTTSVVMPSGFKVTIREQNGEDDGVISKMANADDGTSIDKFLANIIVDTSITPGKKVPWQDITAWRSKDKHYLLMKSRMFSLGNNVNFDHTCTDKKCKHTQTWEEDLSTLDADLSKPALEKNEEGYNPHSVTPYITPMDQPYRELTLSSGKKVRYQYKNGDSDQKVLAMEEGEISKNTPLLIRNIEFWNTKWIAIGRFDIFTAKDMSEIRTDVDKYDSQFEAITEMICPKCKNKDLISLISQPGFFFPQGTL